MRKNGFTLLEVLVATTILGILMAIVTISFQAANRNARDTKRKADVEEIKGAIERYRLEQSDYPLTAGQTETTLNLFLTELQPEYIQKEYEDPFPAAGNQYYYEYRNIGASGCSYVIMAQMEVEGNRQVCPSNCGVNNDSNDYCISD